MAKFTDLKVGDEVYFRLGRGDNWQKWRVAVVDGDKFHLENWAALQFDMNTGKGTWLVPGGKERKYEAVQTMEEAHRIVDVEVGLLMHEVRGRVHSPMSKVDPELHSDFLSELHKLVQRYYQISL